MSSLDSFNKTNHLLVGISQLLLDTRFEPIEPSPNSHNTVQTFQCNCPISSSAISVDALIHSTGYGTLNRLPEWWTQKKMFYIFVFFFFSNAIRIPQNYLELNFQLIYFFRGRIQILQFDLCGITRRNMREEKKSKLVGLRWIELNTINTKAEK